MPPLLAYHDGVRQTHRRRPRKALGQHWLVDRHILARIARAADFSSEDTVVEVGAGTGRLTQLLAQRAARLLAVEIDPELADALGQRFAGHDNVSVVGADVLSLSPEDLLSLGGARLPYVVVGNLPYFVGTAIVRHFLTAHVQPRWLLVTLQAEVARSIAAQAGHSSYLGLQTQLYATPRVLFSIPPQAFRPPPQVRSAVLRLDVRDGTAVEVDDRAAFLRLIQAGFAAPRKQLHNSLAIGLNRSPAEAEAILEEASIDAALRPQALGLGEWAALYRAYRRWAEGESK